MGQTEIYRVYDEKYRTPNFFRDRLWLYRPFVKALVAKIGLRKGARLLDAGCGQGFFTNLFAENGLDTIGVDISKVGISAATSAYASSGAKFVLGDIRRLGWKDEFNCVFTRSCSLYNSHRFEDEREVTEILYSYVRKEGFLIFDYYTRLKPTNRSKDWIYHSVEAVRNHFSRYPGAEVYFSLRIETFLLGKFSFTRKVSRLCERVSYLTGTGGELVAFLQKT
jgi:SAM-dependent methyltransferase